MTLDFDPDQIRIPPGQHHIGGAFLDLPGEEIEVLRPSDGVAMGTIRDGGADAVERAVEAASAALAATRWGRVSPLERAKALRRFAEGIEARVEELARLEAAGSSRIIAATVVRDVVRTAGVIRYYAEYCDKLEGTITSTATGALSLIKNEPYGIVGAIVPWNFPMITAAWKFAPALAAGNAVVMKTSELTPHSLLALAEIAAASGLPGGLFNVVNGWGRTTGSAIVTHPLVRKVSFTGSTATGAIIMTQAAQSGMKPVTLELGGKSPQIVLGDVSDIEATATAVANAFIDNAGQVCTAGSRLIVERKIADRLLDAVEARCAAIRPGPTWAGATSFPPIISRPQAERIDSLVRKTINEGAEARIGGGPLEGQNAGAFYAPTILEGVTREMTGFREEFFGPVLTVDRFDDLEEGLALADHPVYGLAASVHTSDLKTALKACDEIEAGMVWVNQHGRGPEYTYPAGGFKGSGFGKDMGRAGIEAFTRQKAVWVNYDA